MKERSQGTESPKYLKDHNLFYIYFKSPRFKTGLVLKIITMRRSYIV